MATDIVKELVRWYPVTSFYLFAFGISWFGFAMAWAGWGIGWLVLPGGGPALAVLLSLRLAGEKGNLLQRLAADLRWGGRQMVRSSVAFTRQSVSLGARSFVCPVAKHVAGQNSRFAAHLQCGVTHAGNCFPGG